MARRRGEAAARASRANGARSNGPVSAAGKASAARNARKHGLFTSGVIDASTLGAADLELLGHLRSLGAGAWGGDRLIGQAVQALDRLGRVIVLIELASHDVDLMLADEALDTAQLAERVEKLVRLARYERRFRGQLDRAIRALIKLNDEWDVMEVET